MAVAPVESPKSAGGAGKPWPIARGQGDDCHSQIGHLQNHRWFKVTTLKRWHKLAIFAAPATIKKHSCDKKKCNVGPTIKNQRDITSWHKFWSWKWSCCSICVKMCHSVPFLIVGPKWDFNRGISFLTVEYLNQPGVAHSLKFLKWSQNKATKSTMILEEAKYVVLISKIGM